MSRIRKNQKKESKLNPEKLSNRDNDSLSDQNPNQNHNAKKEALGPNTKR